MENFIFTDKIDEGVCRNLINIFECNEKHHFKGEVATEGDNTVDYSQKKSIDMELNNFNLPVIDEYHNQLQKLLMGYIQRYPEVNKLPEFTSTIA